MRVALTVADFLNRAALVYGHRVAVVDEPDVAGSLGTPDLRRARGPGTGDGARPRRPRGRPRRARRHRQPELGPLPGLLLRRQRLRPRPGAHQLPPHRRGDRLRRRASGGVSPPVRPGAGRPGGRHQGGAPLLPRRRRGRRAVRAGRHHGARPQPVGGRRGRPLLGQLHLGHDGAAEGRAAHPAQLLAQRGDLRLAHRA